MSQKLPINNFEWIEETSQFNEDFNYNQEIDEGYFLETDVQYPKILQIILTHFYHEEWRLKKDIVADCRCYTQKKFKTIIKS